MLTGFFGESGFFCCRGEAPQRLRKRTSPVCRNSSACAAARELDSSTRAVHCEFLQLWQGRIRKLQGKHSIDGLIRTKSGWLGGLKDLLDIFKTIERISIVPMKNQFALPALGLLLLAGTISAVAQPKTANPVEIDPEVIGKEPYRFNGAVLSEVGRGSGFCAWNRHTFFSAAHVVYNPGETLDTKGEWLEPPIWAPTINAATLAGAKTIPSRGYYRWTAYGDFADKTGSNSEKTFSQDAILAYAFKGVIPGKPASLNLNGLKDLQKKKSALITGYPAINAYLEQEITGFFLHETGPVVIPYTQTEENYLETSLVTTGPGNSGGPIWTRKKSNGKWQAAGILISGLPSEAGVYAFSSNTRSLLKAVEPVVKRRIGEPVSSDEISASLDQRRGIGRGDAADRDAGPRARRRDLAKSFQASRRGGVELCRGTPDRSDAEIVHRSPGMVTGRLNMFEGLRRQPQVCRRAEQCAGLLDAQVALPDVRALGPHGVDEMDPVIDDQRHTGALEYRTDLTTHTHQVVVAGLLVAVVLRSTFPTSVGLEEANADSNPVGVARLIFGQYIFAFEVVGVLLVTAALGALVLTHRQRLTRRIGQKERSDARVAAGGVLTPLPAPGVFARSNAMDVPALDPTGAPIDDSVSRVLRIRGQEREFDVVAAEIEPPTRTPSDPEVLP